MAGKGERPVELVLFLSACALCVYASGRRGEGGALRASALSRSGSRAHTHAIRPRRAELSLAALELVAGEPKPLRVKIEL